MDKIEVAKALIDFLIQEYEPTIECVAAHGKCDFRLKGFGDECPCSFIIRTRDLPKTD